MLRTEICVPQLSIDQLTVVSKTEGIIMSAAKDRSEVLQSVPEHLRENVEILLNARDEGLRVAILQGGVSGETVGRISDIRIVNGELVFKVEGKDYKPFYGISIRSMGKHVEFSDPNEVLQNAPAHLREDVEILLKAQAEGLRVAIQQGGVFGQTVGVVSDVRIANKELVFKIDGKDYKPFYGISITVLGKSVEVRL